MEREGSERAVGSEGGDLAGTIDFFGVKEVKNRLEGYENSEADFGGSGYESEPESDELPPQETPEPESDDGAGEENLEAAEDEGEGDEAPAKEKIPVEVGDKTLNLPIDAVIPTLVKGKMENPTLQDLRNAYSSKANIVNEIREAKKVKEEAASETRKIKREKESIEVEKATQSSWKAKLKENLQKADFAEVINDLCFELDVDAASLWDSIDGLLEPYYAGTDTQKGWAQLSQAERRALSQSRRVDLMTRRQEAQESKRKGEEREKAFTDMKENILSRAQISMEQVEDAWEQLSEEADSGKMPREEIEKIKKMPPIERFQYAAARAMKNRIKTRVEGIVEGKYPKLKNKMKEIVGDLESILGPQFLAKATDENIAELIAGGYNESISTTRRPGVAGRKNATTSLRDKASPRHKDDSAATSDDDEEDLYSQSGDKPTSQVWGAGFNR